MLTEEGGARRRHAGGLAPRRSSPASNLGRRERGSWILRPHAQAHSEYALGAWEDGRLAHAVIDRTFVDENGTRWVIDYKTSSHEGAGLEEFLQREQERYSEQMERYAVLLRQMFPDEPIRKGLYFPMLKAWREWE